MAYASTYEGRRNRRVVKPAMRILRVIVQEGNELQETQDTPHIARVNRFERFVCR
tara:strand:- start:222 stop:386 length:165 start_codon:yes stop_codon:yes gene_type:complete